MFKLNKRSYAQFRSRIENDVGEEVKNELQGELRNIKSYYEDIAKTIVHDRAAKAVGSESWAVAALDTGREFDYSKILGTIPIERIKEWVLKHKSPGITDKQATREAFAIAKNIKNRGFPSTNFVDIALGMNYEYDTGAQ